MCTLFAEHKIRKRPPYITTFSILLMIFGIGYFFEGTYNSFFFDYISKIILFVNATANIFFAIGLLKGNKWALEGTKILSILNLVYGLILLGQESIIDSLLKFVIYGLILFYLFRPKIKEYFKDSGKSNTPSLHAVPIFSTHKSQLVSMTIPKGSKYLRKIFLLFSIFYFIVFTYLITDFNILVSQDSEINPDTRRTKNLDFNKTQEYYFYLFQYIIVFGNGVTWLVIYLSMQKNKSWSRKIILIVCIIYIGYGKYLLSSSFQDSTGVIAVPTGVATVLLFYFYKSNVRKYYENITENGK